MNTTKTHLTIIYDKQQWIFTGTRGKCNKCINNETDEDYSVKHVLAVGNTSNYNNWVYLCDQHFSESACKKQHCNYCNKNTIIKTVPKICEKCMSHILDNYVLMRNICKYPDIPQSECQCSFCKIR